jgi:hypothetical protein
VCVLQSATPIFGWLGVQITVTGMAIWPETSLTITEGCILIWLDITGYILWLGLYIRSKGNAAYSLACQGCEPLAKGHVHAPGLGWGPGFSSCPPLACSPRQDVPSPPCTPSQGSPGPVCATPALGDNLYSPSGCPCLSEGLGVPGQGPPNSRCAPTLEQRLMGKGLCWGYVQGSLPSALRWYSSISPAIPVVLPHPVGHTHTAVD